MAAGASGLEILGGGGFAVGGDLCLRGEPGFIDNSPLLSGKFAKIPGIFPNTVSFLKAGIVDFYERNRLGIRSSGEEHLGKCFGISFR